MKIPVTTACPQSWNVKVMVKQDDNKNASTRPSVSVLRRPTYQLIVRGRPYSTYLHHIPGISMIENNKYVSMATISSKVLHVSDH